MKPLAALLSLAPLLAAGAANLQFSPTLSPGMVLQRDQPVTVEGQGQPGTTVQLSLASQSTNTEVADDGHWRATFKPLPAGGPFTLSARQGETGAKLDDLLIGDIWLFSGQSNMQMGLGEVEGGPAAIQSTSPTTNIRLLSVPKGAADKPATEIGATWQTCTPGSLRKFSAVAWFFAQHLRRDPTLTDIPLGLIDSSFGGTAIEAWTPAGTLPDIPGDRISGSMFGISPAHLFNHMVAPLAARPIKGAAWYQGEANAGAPDVYSQLLQNMIAQWRQHWNQPDLPFFIVQLPAFEGTMGGLDFGWIREAEHQAAQNSPNTWLATTYDTTDGFDLHPREKEEIGRRLALLARRHTYNQDLVAQGPQFVNMEIANNQVTATFDQPLATRDDKPVRGFSLAGPDGDFHNASATIDGQTVTLSSDDVPAPTSLRFAWGAMPVANLTNQSGLPALPFRTDSLPPDSTAFQPLPTIYRIQTPTYALETGRAGSVAGLVVDGTQFLSNDPPGGTMVPGGWGPRNLAYTTVLGPRHLSLADGGVSLHLAAGDDTMTWTLTNHGNDPIDLHINLATGVDLKNSESTIELSRDTKKLRVEGIARAENNSKLIATAPANGAVEIRWSVTSR